MSNENPKNTVILVWNLIIMVACKASLFVAFAFLVSTALILFSNQLDNAFAEQQHYAPKIARLTAFSDEVCQNEGMYFYRLC